MAHEPTSFPIDPQALDERLVAYLDGELEPAEARQVEELLASDPRAREQLNQLERSWDMMDLLPPAEASETFTESTLEMVAVGAEAEVARHRAWSQMLPAPWRAWLLAAVGVLGAAAVGYGAVSWLAPDPNRELLDALGVVEDFDALRHAESVEFLRALEESKEFEERTAK
jgi:anti-sigma factor RsiW